MSGPTASVVLARQPDPQDLLSRLAVLAVDQSLDDRTDGWTEVFVVTTVPIGGSYAGDARLFEVRWALEEGQWADEDARSAHAHAISAAFGFEPASSICITAGANTPADHRILGEVMLHLAHVYEGVVDFDGELTLRSSLYADARIPSEPVRERCAEGRVSCATAGEDPRRSVRNRQRSNVRQSYRRP